MNNSIVLGLLQNTAVLLAFAMLYENIWLKNEDSKNIWAKIFTGLILGGIGVILMFSPWTFVPGIVFDTRSVMISVAGLFFGPMPTIIAMLIIGSIRFIIGGSGVWMGLAVIFSSGIIGILWRRLRPQWRNKRNYYLELLAMGFIVHLAMSACTVLLPREVGYQTFRIIALPLLFIYTPATMLLGLLMLRQSKNHQNRLVQQKLIESERRLNQVLESGNIASLMLSKDGNITFCNDYLISILGYSHDELYGKNWFDIALPSELKENAFANFSESIRNNQMIKNNEDKVLSKNGKQFYFSWYNIILNSDSGETLGTASIGVNITDRKIYEEKLLEKNLEIEAQNEEYKRINIELNIAKDKAEESDRLKTAFLANMSHEIRTPMNGIMGFANLLKENDLNSDEQKKYIHIIQKSGIRLLNIINDIIDISKIEAGLVKVQLSKTNINEKTEYIYNFFKPEVEEKGISFKLNNTLSNDEAVINTDKEKLYAILTNLVKNAIKFTSTGIIELGYTKKEKEIEFYIKDSGLGVREDKVGLIFERFRQGSESVNRKYEGAGLGLSISKAYVEMLNGKIWVEKNLPNGAIFYFSIPCNENMLATAEMEIPIKEKLLEAPVKNLKILIAEDDEVSEVFLAKLVNELGREIIKVKNGNEAVEICRNNPDIDLVLMDVRMPEMDGNLATKSIREFNKDIVIIAQTAFALSGDREKAIEAGYSDYISKPVDQAELFEIIKKHFSD